MNWHQVDRYHQESDCGRYRIDGADMGPSHMPYRYIFTAWATGRPPENLGVAKTAALARDLCEDHARRTTEL